MARISDNILPSRAQLGLHLDRYAEIVGLNCCAFNGINKPTDNHDTSCIDIVNQSQRNQLAIYLLQAEEMREEELGYFVWPKWWAEEQDVTFNNPFILDRKWLIKVGAPTYTTIVLGTLVNLGVASAPNDPVIFTITTNVATSEIVVTYPGDRANRIYPTKMTAAGGIVTIEIPRCRLVKPSYNDDRDDPPSYYDNAVFLEEVDIYRLYADVAEGAKFVWRMPPCDRDCVPNCQPACAIVTGQDAYPLSIVHLYPAAYSSGAWVTGRFAYSPKPTSVQLQYLSGKRNMSNQIYTIRLAHTLMPRPPCSCDIVKQKWQDDRIIPEGGGWSPYGNMNGAVHTWMTDSRAMVGHGGMFPRVGGLG